MSININETPMYEAAEIKRADPPALVPGLLGDLADQIDLLHKQITVLKTRLRPVMQPEMDGVPKDGVDVAMPSCGEVASRIAEAKVRLRLLTQTVVDATDALEI